MKMDWSMKPGIFFSLFIVLSLACTACSSHTTFPGRTQSPVQAKTLTVLAAASLTESFNEIGKLFESKNPGVKVAFSFAGSQQLAQQLSQGAPADVFASASPKYMDAAVQANRVAKDSPKTFVKNRLVVIFPKDNPAGIQQLSDLAKPGIKLDFGDKSVPVGQYTLDFLDKAAKDPAFSADFKNNVLKNAVSYEDSVKAVVTKVGLGEVDGGIVYVTDVTGSAASKISQLDIPDALNVIAAYPIAPISDSQAPDLARAFVDLVLSKEGQAVLAKYNFVPINP
jgi:molybdate transport system substrate-binding protein